MSSVGAPELIIIFLVCILIFGGSKLPKLARSIGEAKTEFEKSSSSTPSSEAPAEQVTMTKAELETLLDEREAAARRPEAITMTKAELEQLLASAEARGRVGSVPEQQLRDAGSANA